jgi:hypothetical protein
MAALGAEVLLLNQSIAGVGPNSGITPWVPRRDRAREGRLAPVHKVVCDDSNMAEASTRSGA